MICFVVFGLYFSLGLLWLYVRFAFVGLDCMVDCLLGVLVLVMCWAVV